MIYFVTLLAIGFVIGGLYGVKSVATLKAKVDK